ncbi:bifunctional 4-hydroxy-2-oxoglutarate aldolase/2-dehydro-3-deoxy-phosphogluconate aldolase [Terrarubrum flagellatum]|uniref:bifunctional 4-hydroxy-2-oxoglutarate aldolase/2-dehydro-3-deoxy-phosphogluconate aldolase n=1 Tax=Terrirubrum flagellatum TaxID=2895980 RepID=UPI003144F26F
MPNSSAAFAALARRTGVIPVVTIDRVADAVPLTRALLAGGLPIVEVTLRTEAALDAIRIIAAECPEAHVGAGTVLTPTQGQSAVAAGAKFIVSPGSTDALVEASKDWGVPYLPGVATPSEAMKLAEKGLTFLKLFPAEAVGGINLLKSLAAPLPDIKFCPTGGLDAHKAQMYLTLPNVVCVGGAWMTPAAAMKAADWAGITTLAKACAPA